jgi:hypothetical protein
MITEPIWPLDKGVNSVRVMVTTLAVIGTDCIGSSKSIQSRSCWLLNGANKSKLR